MKKMIINQGTLKNLRKTDQFTTVTATAVSVCSDRLRVVSFFVRRSAGKNANKQRPRLSCELQVGCSKKSLSLLTTISLTST